MFRRSFCLLLLLLGGVVGWAEEPDQPAPPKYRRPVLIRVEGEIGSRFEHYLLRKIAYARSLGCDLLLLEIDSPGGGVAETLKLCEELGNLRQMHVVAFLPREALSGAAILSLACDEIIISEFGRIGDCGPIFLADDFLFRHAPEKFRSDLVARVRIIAESNGHSPALAEAMVDFTVKVERYRLPDGTEKFFTDREVQSRPAPPDGERIEVLPESGNGRLLELSGKRAKELHLATANIEDRAKLLEHFGLEKRPLELRPTALDTTVFILNHWFVTALILVVGMIGMVYELSAPGIGVGGVGATLCFVLFFWSRFLGGTSGWLEVMLFGVGLLFLALELFVIPGFGITGVTGIVLILTSLVLASQDFMLPTTTEELSITLRSTLTALFATVACVGFSAVMVRYMGSIPMLNRLMLQPPVDRADSPPLAATVDGKAGPVGSALIAVGDWGTAVTHLRPGGKAQFGDLIVDVVSDGAFIAPSTPLRVTQLRGSRVEVEQAEA